MTLTGKRAWTGSSLRPQALLVTALIPDSSSRTQTDSVRGNAPHIHCSEVVLRPDTHRPTRGLLLHTFLWDNGSAQTLAEMVKMYVLEYDHRWTESNFPRTPSWPGSHWSEQANARESYLLVFLLGSQGCFHLGTGGGIDCRSVLGAVVVALTHA